jgi:glutamate synthase (NADPH/NADH) large chain
MSLSEYIGRVGTGILNPDETNCKMVRLPHPILTNTQLDILCNIRYKGFNTRKLKLSFTPADEQPGEALRAALDSLCQEVARSVDEGYNYIILSDRDLAPADVPIPSLLAVSAVHHYLISVANACDASSREWRDTRGDAPACCWATAPLPSAPTSPMPSSTTW